MSFCSKCPRKLSRPPNEPCPLALARVNNRVANKSYDENQSDVSCPWAINSAEHNYCFWNLSKELDNDPLNDKQICQLLNINTATLEKIWQSIVKKLKDNKDSKEMADWIDLLRHKADISRSDETIYLPDQFKTEVEKKNQEADEDEGLTPEEKLEKELIAAAEEKDKRLKRLKMSGMPLHLSQKRTDLWGLSKKYKPRKNKK